jgi:hypothetical protein
MKNIQLITLKTVSCLLRLLIELARKSWINGLDNYTVYNAGQDPTVPGRTR